MTHPLRILLVDDELLALRRLELLLRRMPEAELIGTARTGHDALARIADLKPDAILLDIRMAGMNGLDVAAALDGPDAPLVIFVTAFDEFAARAFELSALDYVVKPVEFGRLREAIVRAAARLEMSDARLQLAELREIVASLRAERAPSPAAGGRDIWVQRRGQFVRLALGDVEWAEAERDYVRLHAGAESYLIRSTLTALQARLGEASFVRIRRSAIVRADRVQSIRKAGYGDVRVRLISGQELRVGRTYLRQVRALLSAQIRP